MFLTFRVKQSELYHFSKNKIVYTLVTSVCCFSRSLELLLGLPMQILHFKCWALIFSEINPCPLLFGWASNIILLMFVCVWRCDMCVHDSGSNQSFNYWIKWNFAHKFSEGKFSVKFNNGQNCLNHIEMAAIWTLKINVS